MAIDYQAPDYSLVIHDRAKRYEILSGSPETLRALKKYYAENPWDFISDWGTTFEPRNVEKGLLTTIPFFGQVISGNIISLKMSSRVSKGIVLGMRSYIATYYIIG